MSSSTNTLVKELYEPHVLAARGLLETDPGLKKLMDPNINPLVLELFLIQYAAHGVRMTRPVEGWIRRAGARALEEGLRQTKKQLEALIDQVTATNMVMRLTPEKSRNKNKKELYQSLGAASEQFTELCQKGLLYALVGGQLNKHARHEADHDKMFLEDVHNLTTLWNAKGQLPKLNAEELLSQPPHQSTKDYIKLHEDTIYSDLPAGQVAIEYEIERLSVVYLTPMLENVKKVCGPDVRRGQSFLHDHTLLDVAHTALNEKMMGEVLKTMPEKAQRLGEIGSEALRIYIRSLNDHLAQAERIVAAQAKAA